MNKRTDAQIYIYNHKPLDYGIWDNQLYTPLEVGAYYREPIENVRDNSGDNITRETALSGNHILWKWRR